jgi:hypothetical protein
MEVGTAASTILSGSEKGGELDLRLANTDAPYPFFCGFVYKGRFVMGENKKKVLFETELYFLLEVSNEYQDLKLWTIFFLYGLTVAMAETLVCMNSPVSSMYSLRFDNGLYFIFKHRPVSFF